MQTRRTVILVILTILFNTTLGFTADGLRSIRIVAKDGEILEPFGQSWAVVVGIDDYQKVGKLKYAVNDAKAVKQMLQEYGFEEDHIFTLYDNKATKNGILQMLGDELPYKIGDRDRLLVYFAGHGESSLDNGYLIPVDFRQGEYRASAISMTELKDILKDIKAKHIYMVLDACYSGMFFTTRAAGVEKEHPRYLQEITKRKARQALTAGGKEPVSDGGYKNHSAFTGTFLEALSTGMADYNGDGIITASEINAYIQPKVAEIAEQTPEFGNLPGSEGGEFVFIAPSGSSNEADLMLEEMERELGKKEKELKRLEEEEKVITEKQKAEDLRLKIEAIEKEMREKEKSIENMKDNKSLVAYYPFNGNANDESGNGNNGTVNGAKLTTDRFGKENSAYSFNGRNSYVSLGNPANLQLNDPFTIELWFKQNDVPVWYPNLIGHGTGGWSFGLSNLAGDEGKVYISHSGQPPYLTGTTVLKNGVWYHLAVTRMGSISSIYVNGILENTSNNSPTFSFPYEMRIGQDSSGGGHVNGIIDEVRIYNYALSESEIQSIYNTETKNNSNDMQTIDWVVGNWKYYSADGKTWLFNIKISRNGVVYEFRLTDWNKNIYNQYNFEYGRLVSELTYDTGKNIFSGNHYRVEDGTLFDKVNLTIVDNNNLRYEGINNKLTDGQHLRR